jgi:hypothetical protein
VLQFHILTLPHTLCHLTSMLILSFRPEEVWRCQAGKGRKPIKDTHSVLKFHLVGVIIARKVSSMGGGLFEVLGKVTEPCMLAMLLRARASFLMLAYQE